MFERRITVFTPTFNRAHLISNLYLSLKKQTFSDFEWLVVDDGSIDDTEKLINTFIKEHNTFTIKYHKTKNGGKHRAVNYGLQLASGEIFFTVDSDDYLTDDALFKIDLWFKDISKNNSIVGIVANRGYSDTNTPNRLFTKSFIDKTLLDMKTYTECGNLVLDGERAIAFYTDFHRKYTFPEFEGERFITEAVVYNRMAHDGHKMRFYNDIIWIYEYQEDGLTKQGNSIFINNPMGYGLWLRELAEFTNKTRFEKLKMQYTFTCDLSAKYDANLIARAIGTKVFKIKLLLLIHKIKKHITTKN